MCVCAYIHAIQILKAYIYIYVHEYAYLWFVVNRGDHLKSGGECTLHGARHHCVCYDLHGQAPIQSDQSHGSLGLHWDINGLV